MYQCEPQIAIRGDDWVARERELSHVHRPLIIAGETEMRQHTQAFEQADSNSAISFPHFRRASLSSLIASRILLSSRQEKNKSRPSQHFCREDRSGAMRPPSEAVFFESEDQGNQPIVIGVFLRVTLGRERDARKVLESRAKYESCSNKSKLNGPVARSKYTNT